MKIWVIRNIHTKLYFPEPRGREGRGGSFTMPDQPGTSDNIRLFRSKLSASRFLGSWLRGEVHHSSGSYEDYCSGGREYYEENEIVHKPDRKREDIEIIEKEIIL